MDTAIILDRLNNSLAEAGTWLEGTKDFAVEQTPLVIKEVLYWGFAVETFEFLISLGILVFGIVLVKRAKTLGWYTKAENYDGESYAIALFGSWTTVVMGAVASVINALDPIKVVVAPRLYLIEYFRELLNAGGK